MHLNENMIELNAQDGRSKYYAETKVLTYTENKI